MVSEGMHRGAPSIDADAIRSSITPCELEVLWYLARGKSDKQVAFELDKAYRTVKNQVGSLLQKLCVENRTAAVIRAHRLKIIDLDSDHFDVEDRMAS
jgi:DNA-binding NarL/FixJ family response regulator